MASTDLAQKMETFKIEYDNPAITRPDNGRDTPTVSRPERRLAMLPNVILLVLAALVSSFLWWRTRFKDMSAVSITDKTVGNRLPCLWCGAVGRRTKCHLTESNVLLPCSKNES